MMEIGRVYNFEFNDGGDPEVGRVVQLGAAWILVQHIPFDYRTDGWMLIARNHILAADRDEEEERAELVLRLKGIDGEQPNFQLELDDTAALFHSLHELGDLVQIGIEDEDALDWVGRIQEIGADTVDVWLVEEGGAWDEVDTYDFSELKKIGVKTDYTQSIALLNDHQTH